MEDGNDLKELSKILGILLKKRRDDGHHSQEEFSLKVGKHRQWVSKIENGNSLPSILNLHYYTKAVGIDMGELLNEACRIFDQQKAPAKMVAEHNQGLDYFIRNKRRKANNKD